MATKLVTRIVLGSAQSTTVRDNKGVTKFGTFKCLLLR